MQLTFTGGRIDTSAVLQQHVESNRGVGLRNYFKTAIEARAVFSEAAQPSRGFHLPNLTAGEPMRRLDLANYSRLDGNTGWIDPHFDPARRIRRHKA